MQGYLLFFRSLLARNWIVWRCHFDLWILCLQEYFLFPCCLSKSLRNNWLPNLWLIVQCLHLFRQRMGMGLFLEYFIWATTQSITGITFFPGASIKSPSVRMATDLPLKVSLSLTFLSFWTASQTAPTPGNKTWRALFYQTLGNEINRIEVFA